MKVAFLTRYDERRASSRVRAFRYAPYLAGLGVRARYLPWDNRPRRAWPAYVTRACALARWADVVVLQKPFHPSWFVAALTTVNPSLVVDVDDAIWTPSNERDAARAAEIGRRLEKTVRRAKAAIAGNSHIAAWLRAHAPKTPVTVLPSPVEPERFPMHRHEATGSIVAGWIGSPENLRDLEVCLGPLRRLVAQGLVRVRVVSSRKPGFDDLDVEFVEWSREREPADVAGFDVGLMPLADTPRTRGRCGFKAIEYMAAGVPVVASCVPGPSDVVADGVTGFLARDEEDWERLLGDLAADPALRARVGAAGRRAAEERFSTSVCVGHLVALLRSVCAGAARQPSEGRVSP